MKKFLLFLFGVICVLFTGTLLHADLLDYGVDGALFHDSKTGLYWYDPGTFTGWTLDEIDTFVHNYSLWNWAGNDQMEYLVGSMAADSGSSLTDVLGDETYTSDSLCYWVGFIDPKDTYAAEGIGSVAGLTGIQLYTTLQDDSVISGTILCGAWLYSKSDPLEYTAPVPEPSTIFLIGSGLIGFAGVIRKFGKKQQA